MTMKEVIEGKKPPKQKDKTFYFILAFVSAIAGIICIYYNHPTSAFMFGMSAGTNLERTENKKDG